MDDIDKKDNVTADADPNKVCISRKEYDELISIRNELGSHPVGP